MFKAYLIEDKAYFKLKRKQLVIMYVSILPFWFFISVFEAPNWAGGLVLFALVFILFKEIQTGIALQKISNNTKLEASESEVVIRSKNDIQKFQLKTIDTIIVNKEYNLPEESMNDLKKSMKGAETAQFIELKKDGHSDKFLFEIDSYYMINQIEKLIPIWQNNGFRVVRV